MGSVEHQLNCGMNPEPTALLKVVGLGKQQKVTVADQACLGQQSQHPTSLLRRQA